MSQNHWSKWQQILKIFENRDGFYAKHSYFACIFKDPLLKVIIPSRELPGGYNLEIVKFKDWLDQLSNKGKILVQIVNNSKNVIK